ncbi:hypothetical protein D3C77_684670 [compost metagenome]
MGMKNASTTVCLNLIQITGLKKSRGIFQEIEKDNSCFEIWVGRLLSFGNVN